MGMRLEAALFLQRNGWLSPDKNKILDIGPQTIYFVESEHIREFVKNQGGPALGVEGIDAEIERLVHFSTPRPNERTTMLSEITDLTNIEYASIDVCPGLKNTEILDLNFDSLPDHMRESYDVVFNFGTTEHIVNQWNCFKVIHEALKPGGVAYHQLPASGYLDHGYFCYTPLLFRELAEANGYELLQLAVTPAGQSRIDELGIRSLQGETILAKSGHLAEDNRVPALNMHVILRKTRPGQFRVPLEIATTHAPVNEQMLSRYTSDEGAVVVQAADERDLARKLATVSRELVSVTSQFDAMRKSRSWRYTQPLRNATFKVKHLLRHVRARS